MKRIPFYFDTKMKNVILYQIWLVQYSINSSRASNDGVAEFKKSNKLYMGTFPWVGLIGLLTWQYMSNLKLALLPYGYMLGVLFFHLNSVSSSLAPSTDESIKNIQYFYYFLFLFKTSHQTTKVIKKFSHNAQTCFSSLSGLFFINRCEIVFSRSPLQLARRVQISMSCKENW